MYARIGELCIELFVPHCSQWLCISSVLLPLACEPLPYLNKAIVTVNMSWNRYGSLLIHPPLSSAGTGIGTDVLYDGKSGG